MDALVMAIRMHSWEWRFLGFGPGCSGDHTKLGTVVRVWALDALVIACSSEWTLVGFGHDAPVIAAMRGTQLGTEILRVGGMDALVIARKQESVLAARLGMEVPVIARAIRNGRW